MNKMSKTIHLPMRSRKPQTNTLDPFFPVTMKKYVREDGVYDKVMAVVNETTKKTMGVVSEGYNLVTHKDASSLVKDFLTKVGIKFVSEGGATGTAGSRYFETISFPDYAFTPDGTKSTALDVRNMGAHERLSAETMVPFITVKNSYDKTAAISWSYGAARLLCANGMAVISSDSTFMSYRHNQTIDYAKVKEVLLDNLQKNIDIIKIAYDRLNEEQGVTYLRDLIDGDYPDKFKLAVLERITPYATVESEEVLDETGKHKVLKIKSLDTPESAWAVYNVATDVASHVLTSRVDQDKVGRRLAKEFAIQ